MRFPARPRKTTNKLRGESLTLPAESVIRWGELPAIQAGPVVVLAGGGLLVADPLSLRDETLRVYAEGWDEISVPLSQVRGIMCRVPHTYAQLDAQLAAIRQAEGDRDVVTLAGGDQIRGVLLGLGPDGYLLETEAGRVEIDPKQVVQVICAPALVETPEPPARPLAVGFRNGSYLFASEIELSDGRLRLESPGLGTLNSPRGLQATDELRIIQPLGSTATYLSDLEPHSYRHLPFRGEYVALGNRPKLPGRHAARRGDRLPERAGHAQRLTGGVQPGRRVPAVPGRAGARCGGW